VKPAKVRVQDVQVARRAAEEAVNGMPDGDLKIKAFEVILQHLLVVAPPEAERSPAKKASSSRGSRPRRTRAAAGSRQETGVLTQRIMGLKDSGFFKEQKMIGEVRQELKAGGWHYPVTTISPIMLRLTQQRKLRREQVKSGNRKVWMYSNP
jgi:hypothetical protein